MFSCEFCETFKNTFFTEHLWMTVDSELFQLFNPMMTISNVYMIILWTVAVARGASRTTATSKMERFVIIVNGFQPLTNMTKRSILDVAAVLDPPLVVGLIIYSSSKNKFKCKNKSSGYTN